MDALVPQMLVVMQKEDMLAFLNECKKECKAVYAVYPLNPLLTSPSRSRLQPCRCS